MTTWTHFGWQGIRVEAPTDWELVGIPKEQDPNAGYLRLDDALQPRLELKWEARAQRKFDIQKTLDDYLSGIRKTYEREVGHIEIKRGDPFIPNTEKFATFHEHREILFFSWRGKLRAQGLIWRCAQCGRVLMAQVVGSESEPKEEFRQTATRILLSLRCHTDGDANLWTAYGLQVEVPRRFRLDKLSLLNGYILFSYTDGSQRVAVERYGFADQQLGGGDLEAWFRRVYAKSLHGMNFTLEGGDALSVVGQESRLLDHADRWVLLTPTWDRLFRRNAMSAQAWHSPEANRLFVVRVTGKTTPERTATRIAQSIPSSPCDADALAVLKAAGRLA